jgi:8-amino-7-oxononanoate synthase
MENFERRIEGRLKTQRAAGLLRRPYPIAQRCGRQVVVGGRRLVNFASNDYLGLGDSPKLAEIVAASFRRHGTSASASRLVSGHYETIIAAERAFADHFGFADALFFPSGYQANLAVVGTLFHQGDLVCFDKHVHASTVNGLVTSGARFVGFNHNRMDHLEKRIKTNRCSHRALGVLSEALFSMDGDLLDVDGLRALKARHGFLTLVDEAHSAGALGRGGRGIGRTVADVAVGTLGKAFGLFGAFLLLPEGFKDYLFNFAAPLIYSTTLPPAHAVAAKEILRLVAEREDLRHDLAQVSRWMRGALAAQGYRVAGAAHILALEVGDETAAETLSRRLFEAGFLVLPARYPTVPLGKAIIRISLTARHTENDVARFVQVVRECHDPPAPPA